MVILCSEYRSHVMGRDHESLACLPCAVAFHAAFHTFSYSLSQVDIKAQRHGSPRPHGSGLSPHICSKPSLVFLIPSPQSRRDECVWGEPGLSPWVWQKPSMRPEKTKFQLLPPLPHLYPWSLPSFVRQHWEMNGTLIMVRRVAPHCCVSRPVFLRMRPYPVTESQKQGDRRTDRDIH